MALPRSISTTAETPPLPSATAGAGARAPRWEGSPGRSDDAPTEAAGCALSQRGGAWQGALRLLGVDAVSQGAVAHACAPAAWRLAWRLLGRAEEGPRD